MAKSKTVLLVANGDLRLSANQVCWPAQHAMEQALTAAVAQLGYKLVRAHPYNPRRNTVSSAPKRKAWRFSPNSTPRLR